MEQIQRYPDCKATGGRNGGNGRSEKYRRRRRRGRLDFPRAGKIFARSSAHRNLSPLCLSPPRRSRFPVSSISAIPSPYSEVSQPAATFAPRLRFFPLSSPFLGLSVFARASQYILSYSYPALSRSPLSVCVCLSVPLCPVAFWPARIGKYESFVPSALSGIRVCHGHTRETSSERGPVVLCACVRECVRLFARRW